MKRPLLTLLLIVAIIHGISFFTASKANAKEEAIWRMSSNQICVQKINTDFKGWRLGAAIRSWNATGQVYFYRSTNCNTDLAHIYLHSVDEIVIDGVVQNWLAYTNYTGALVEYQDEGATVTLRNINLVFDTSYLMENYIPPFRKCVGWRATVHELGHAMGLQHNELPDSVMSDLYDTFNNCMIMTPTDAYLASQIGY